MTDIPGEYVTALIPEVRARADCDPDVRLLVALLARYKIPPHRLTVEAVDELMRLVIELAADDSYRPNPRHSMHRHDRHIERKHRNEHTTAPVQMRPLR